ncbi:alpha/beta hydrolase [Salinarimonas soli]|nr:alpha/beta fold hydrolase [Salinarimonas soli]
MPLGRAFASAIRERPLVLEGDPAPLHGTLTLPDAPSGETPGVLIVAGSGPVDRDGNLPGMRNDSLKQLAHGLAQRGIASLRVDKRGIGMSREAAPREEDLRFGTYVEDAARWAHRLRAEPGIGRVALIGHSEGALVVTMAAKTAGDVVGLVLVAGAGQAAGRLIRQQLAAAGLPPALREAADRALSELEVGRMVPDAPRELAALFRPSVQPYMASWVGLDPAAELAATGGPALVIQGTTDLQVSPDDAGRLAASRAGVERVLVEGMNHVLKAAPPDRAANLATYGDPALPIVPGVVDRIAGFLGVA